LGEVVFGSAAIAPIFFYLSFNVAVKRCIHAAYFPTIRTPESGNWSILTIFCRRWNAIVIRAANQMAVRFGHQGGALMLWTAFMLFMFAWMLGLIFKFGLGVIPLVIVLTTIVAFIHLIRRAAFTSRKSPAHATKKIG
jgi:hypothetical protein